MCACAHTHTHKHRWRRLFSADPSSAFSPLTLLQVSGKRSGTLTQVSPSPPPGPKGPAAATVRGGNRSRCSRFTSRRPEPESLRVLTIFADPSPRLRPGASGCSHRLTNRFQCRSATQNRRPGPCWGRTREPGGFSAAEAEPKCSLAAVADSPAGCVRVSALPSAPLRSSSSKFQTLLQNGDARAEST